MYPKSQELKKLGRNFQMYFSFWNEWSLYKFNGLSETDIYIINVLSKRNFKYTLDDMLMFYFRTKTVKELTEKLEKNYPAFKEWLITKFQVSLSSLAAKYDLEPKYNRSLLLYENRQSRNIQACLSKKIEYLFLNEDLKQVLLQFGFESLGELVETYSDDDFKRDDIFKTVIDFQIIFNKQKNVIVCNTLSTILN